MLNKILLFAFNDHKHCGRVKNLQVHQEKHQDVGVLRPKDVLKITMTMAYILLPHSQ